MKSLSLFFLFLFGAISFAGLLAVRRRYRIRRLNQIKLAPLDSEAWTDIAEGLFASHGETRSPSTRIELAMRSGMRRLGLSCGIITINSAHSSRVVSLFTAEDIAPEWLTAGREVSLALTYCGLLQSDRENLAIDFASLSDWRHHSAHRDLGWETFIGTRKLLSSGEYLAIGFFDWHAREHIYGREEKNFVGQLASWISVINESEVLIESETVVPEMTQISLAHALENSVSQ
ncbi:MAG: hypothetical protein ACXWQO_11345 [Bdellovibrionota bacterium]